MGSDDVPLANIEIALYAAKQQQKGPFAYSRIAMSGRG